MTEDTRDKILEANRFLVDEAWQFNSPHELRDAAMEIFSLPSTYADYLLGKSREALARRYGLR